MKKFLISSLVAAGVFLPFSTSCGNGDKAASDSAKTETTEQAGSAASKDSPIWQLFSSMDNLKNNITGMYFVSANNDCIIDMSRDSRYKIFIKNNGEWLQFNGEKYQVTYSGNDLCIDYKNLNGPEDGYAMAIFTPQKLTLTCKSGKEYTAKDFRIASSSEAEQAYYK